MNQVSVAERATKALLREPTNTGDRCLLTVRSASRRRASRSVCFARLVLSVSALESARRLILRHDRLVRRSIGEALWSLVGPVVRRLLRRPSLYAICKKRQGSRFYTEVESRLIDLCLSVGIAIWLILPVVIRSSQRLSHACLSINDFVL